MTNVNMTSPNQIAVPPNELAGQQKAEGTKPAANVEQTNQANDKNSPAKLNSLEALNNLASKTSQANQASQAEVREKLTSVQLEKVAQQLQNFVGEMNTGLEFLVDEDTGRDVIKIIDQNSGDVIKQFPSEDVLELVANLSEATGNFIDSKV